MYQNNLQQAFAVSNSNIHKNSKTIRKIITHQITSLIQNKNNKVTSGLLNQLGTKINVMYTCTQMFLKQAIDKQGFFSSEALDTPHCVTGSEYIP